MLYCRLSVCLLYVYFFVTVNYNLWLFIFLIVRISFLICWLATSYWQFVLVLKSTVLKKCDDDIVTPQICSNISFTHQFFLWSEAPLWTFLSFTLFYLKLTIQLSLDDIITSILNKFFCPYFTFTRTVTVLYCKYSIRIHVSVVCLSLLVCHLISSYGQFILVFYKYAHLC